MAKFRFTVGPWNVHTGADSYGPETRQPIDLETKFAKFAELGFSAVQFHDDDAVPNINNMTEEEIKEYARGVKKLLDKYGIAPPVLIRELPFYSGMFITNNGSIGLHHPLHHIYNFGDVSLFIGMGSVQKEAFVEPDGKTRMRRWLPLGITADERVCSGAHYAAFFSEVIRLLDNPEELETPPEEVRFEQGVEYHVPKISEQK